MTPLEAGSCPCNADLNGNGIIDNEDFACVFGVFSGCAFGLCQNCDVNCDGRVDIGDADAVECQLNGFPPEDCCESGACCLLSGDCAEYTGAACESTFHGAHQGNGTACGSVQCVGACCLGDSCFPQSEATCTLLGGAFRGVGTICNSSACRGACCLNETTCLEQRTGLECRGALNGTFLGLDSVCPNQVAHKFREAGGVVFVHVIRRLGGCFQGGTRMAIRGECDTADLIDPWVSGADPEMCHHFGVSGSPAIPAGFFGKGSEPFSDDICLEGVPLGPTSFGDFGDADTLIRRSADPFDRCSLPSSAQSTVDVEIVALNLVSVSPITVIIDAVPTEWNVAVDLSEVTPPAGSLTATKTHCNGGTYTSTLNAQARFTFTRVDDPGQVFVLDTGLEGVPPVTLDQSAPQPWVHDLDPNLAATTDPCSTFHPGIEEISPVADCDCNGTGIRDSCDIAIGTSLDVNANGVPDECEKTICLCGDFDGSATVDLLDFATFARCFALAAANGSCSAEELLCCDLNGSGGVDLDDFLVFVQVFGTTPTNAPPKCP